MNLQTDCPFRQFVGYKVVFCLKSNKKTNQPNINTVKNQWGVRWHEWLGKVSYYGTFNSFHPKKCWIRNQSIYSLGGGVWEFWRDHMIFRGDGEEIGCRLKRGTTDNWQPMRGIIRILQSLSGGGGLVNCEEWWRETGKITWWGLTAKRKRQKFIPVNSIDVGSAWYFPSMPLFRVSFMNSTNCRWLIWVCASILMSTLGITLPLL